MSRHYTDQERTKAAQELGITVPYWHRVVGDRIEFYPQQSSTILIWPVNLDTLTKTELRALAAQRGIQTPSKATKAELVDLLSKP